MFRQHKKPPDVFMQSSCILTERKLKGAAFIFFLVSQLRLVPKTTKLIVLSIYIDLDVTWPFLGHRPLFCIVPQSPLSGHGTLLAFFYSTLLKALFSDEQRIAWYFGALNSPVRHIYSHILNSTCKADPSSAQCVSKSSEMISGSVHFDLVHDLGYKSHRLITRCPLEQLIQARY